MSTGTTYGACRAHVTRGALQTRGGRVLAVVLEQLAATAFRSVLHILLHRIRRFRLRFLRLRRQPLGVKIAEVLACTINKTETRRVENRIEPMNRSKEKCVEIDKSIERKVRAARCEETSKERTKRRLPKERKERYLPKSLTFAMSSHCDASPSRPARPICCWYSSIVFTPLFYCFMSSLSFVVRCGA
jgi:hypothetical protein